MLNKEKTTDVQTVSLCEFCLKVSSCVRTFATALAMVFGLTLLTTHVLQAQTFSVLHYFTGEDGANPNAGVTVGPGGVLYGTAGGGAYGDGTVFRLSQVNASWFLRRL